MEKQREICFWSKLLWSLSAHLRYLLSDNVLCVASACLGGGGDHDDEGGSIIQYMHGRRLMGSSGVCGTEHSIISIV